MSFPVALKRGLVGNLSYENEFYLRVHLRKSNLFLVKRFGAWPRFET